MGDDLVSAAARAGTRHLAFARHGETAWTGSRYAGRTDLPLDDRGIATAAALASRVAESGVLGDPAAVIVASPLLRAWATARAVARAVDRPVEADPRWMEVAFGSLEGLTFDEASLASPELAGRLVAGDLEIDWPGGETWSGFRERIAAALQAVLARGVPVLVVGHGIAIRVALAMLLGHPVRRKELPALPAGGLVVVRGSEGAWVLETQRADGVPI